MKGIGEICSQVKGGHDRCPIRCPHFFSCEGPFLWGVLGAPKPKGVIRVKVMNMKRRKASIGSNSHPTLKGGVKQQRSSVKARK